MDFTLQTSFVAWIMCVEQEICVLQICMLSTVETFIRYKISMITCRLSHILYMLIMVTIVLVHVSTVLAL